MWHTAEAQAMLKRQAGVRTTGTVVIDDPVKTISMNWHEDDKPTREHMIESADGFLKHMGRDQHQAATSPTTIPSTRTFTSFSTVCIPNTAAR